MVLGMVEMTQEITLESGETQTATFYCSTIPEIRWLQGRIREVIEKELPVPTGILNAMASTPFDSIPTILPMWQGRTGKIDIGGGKVLAYKLAGEYVTA